ncbi:amino acid ABC transporter permease (plasmid) [Azospirillum argentinense]|uniref:Amino acid ABC transporter permease n=1 Tax=Azospirillum argentinense TaxID=2970906 RepID=A0A060DQ60_9PROT|nr:branched-chain amino acid ABC transporter permease [Azospirillum argentinense]AIB15986.1 amino acid ABC transporter permease [Azospirillum argentinense]EZQ03460.1 amino acid ABC transporter permease [Azospirillum argentinense]
MIDLLLAQQPLAELILVNAILAYSQYIALRAGVFSLATAGLASLGAYTAAVLTVRWGVPMPLGLAAAALAGAAAGGLLALPLARLRGVFQAIATLAFVQIVLSLALYAEPLTGGAMGMNGLPRTVQGWHLLGVFALVLYLVFALSRGGVGRAFDTIRQEETVAVSLGIRVVRYHRLAFALSGAIAGLGGGVMAHRNYSLVPEDFGFPLLVSVLTFVVLGGRAAVLGPLAGAAVLTALPELARPLADYRLAVNGLLMVLFIVHLPHGVVDTVILQARRLRLAARRRAAEAQA